MGLDEDRQLWSLLGSARETPVPARFAPDVMRAIRTQTPEPRTSPWQAFLRMAFPVGATAAAGLCLLLALPEKPSPEVASISYREAADLDDLLSPSAGWAWHEVAP